MAIGGAAKAPVILTDKLLATGTASAGTDESASALPHQGVDLKKHLAALERRAIEEALRQAGGVVQRSADAPGVG